MAETVYVVPAKGVQVPVPGTGSVLPPEGMEVALTSFWRRRVRAGEVTIREKAAPAPKASSATKAKE